MRVMVAAVLVLTAFSAEAQRLNTSLQRGEEAALIRTLDEAARRRRGTDPWVNWDGHFLQGAGGRTYVPYTVRLRGAAGTHRTVAVAVRVVGWNYTFADTFATTTDSDGDDRVFRGAFLVRAGRATVYVSVMDRDARSPRIGLVERIVIVPGFEGDGLRLSSVIVVERVEDVPKDTVDDPRRPPYPYAMGTAHLIPARTSEFTRDGTLTVAFQVYNAATFEDGRPDVEVRYRVYHKDGDRKPVGSTAPQLFDQESLPEEFDLKHGFQLTPVQSIPLSQFEAGAYRLEIEVEDHLGRAHVRTDVPFTIVR